MPADRNAVAEGVLQARLYRPRDQLRSYNAKSYSLFLQLSNFLVTEALLGLMLITCICVMPGQVSRNGMISVHDVQLPVQLLRHRLQSEQHIKVDAQIYPWLLPT